MDYDSIIKQIIDFSKEFYDILDFAHNIEHGKRVVSNAGQNILKTNHY